MTYRYLSGRPLTGRQTDGGYLSSGTKALDGARASRWILLPGYKRQAWRIGTPTAAVALGASYLTHPLLTELGAGTAVAAGTTYAGSRAYRRMRTRRFDRMYTEPLADAIRPMLGIPAGTPARSFVTIPTDMADLYPRLTATMRPVEVRLRAAYGRQVEPVVRWLPERAMRLYWAAAGTRLGKLLSAPDDMGGTYIEVRTSGFVPPDIQKAVGMALRAKLGLSDLVESWSQVGPTVRARYAVRKRPPTGCTLDDIREAMAKCAEDEFVAGLGPDRSPVVISLSEDSPHIACSAGSGAGKSVLAKLIAVQVLMHGGSVIILDKKGSHRWARGLPGVTYCQQPADMHAALIGANDLSERRNLDVFREDEGYDPGARVFIIFEEMNATVAALRQWWATARQKEDPKASPAIDAFRNIMFMGRSAKVNLFGVAQMLTANTTGGPESRENFGVRCLARFTNNAWKMLVPECAIPARSKVRGRWHIVTGGEVVETQVAFLSDDDVRGLMADVPVSPDMLPAGLRSEDYRDRDSGDMPADPLSERMTLAQAVAEGLVGPTYEAARKRAQRSRELVAAGKRGQANLYRRADLIEWAAKTDD